MAFIQGTKDHGGNEELKAAFEAAIQAGWQYEGKPNNFVETMASRPGLLNGLLAMTGAVFSGEVPMTVKLMLWYTLAERTNCEYCAVAQRNILKQMGVQEEIIKSCAQDPDLSALPPAQRAIVNFGYKVAKNPKEMTADDYQTLRDQGLSEGEILEIVWLASYAVMLDVTADAVGIQLDGQ